MFEDEDFIKQHDEPFLLSMANKGKDTNGSQFFITTRPAPHLNGLHVVFGKVKPTLRSTLRVVFQVVSGMNVISEVEQLKTNAKSRPNADVIINSCGELVRSQKTKKKKRHTSSSSSGDGRLEFQTTLCKKN